jgi:hypothetical protein
MLFNNNVNGNNYEHVMFHFLCNFRFVYYLASYDQHAMKSQPCHPHAPAVAPPGKKVGTHY